MGPSFPPKSGPRYPRVVPRIDSTIHHLRLIIGARFHHCVTLICRSQQGEGASRGKTTIPEALENSHRDVEAT